MLEWRYSPIVLLDQMILEIDGIRPAVLSIDLKEELEDYRGLRHVKGVEEIGFLIININ
jgi:hypothetical protein